MGAPVSYELRERVVAAWQKKKLTGLELAELFGIGEATVKRIKRRFLDTGSVKPKPHGGGTKPIIGKGQEPLVEALVQKHPDWSEDQSAKALADEHGVVASAVTVGRAIRKLGYSVKKRRSSRKSVIEQASSNDESDTSSESKTLPLHVWFLWTKLARTRR
jgi:transposase